MTDHKAEWVLVPRVPTPEMLRAGFLTGSNELHVDQPADAPGLVWAAMIAAAPAASEGEDGAVLWISPEDFRNPHFVGINAVRAGHEQHGKHYTMPLYTRPAAQAADGSSASPKHDEGRDLFDAAYEAAHEGKQGQKGVCRYWWNAALATQPAARRVTDAQAQRFAEIARDGTVSDFQQEFAAIRSWFAAQPAEGVE